MNNILPLLLISCLGGNFSNIFNNDCNCNSNNGCGSCFNHGFGDRFDRDCAGCFYSRGCDGRLHRHCKICSSRICDDFNGSNRCNGLNLFNCNRNNDNCCNRCN